MSPLGQTTVSLHIALAVTLCCAAVTCAQATFTPLGDLPGGRFESFGQGISADGLVVVGSAATGIDTQPFRWTAAGGMVGLGHLPGGTDGFAEDASADGSVVVGVSGTSRGDRAIRWTMSGGMVELGDLAGGSFESIAHGVSANGTIIAGVANTLFPNQSQAFRWTQSTGTVGLGDLPGDQDVSGASAISADGAVIVGFGSGGQAFRWTVDEGMVGLGDLPGGEQFSTASGTSADGSVIVGASTSARSGNVFEAFRWTAGGGMVGLGDLPGGPLFSFAFDVSADGSVAVGYGHVGEVREAFYWTADNGMVHLRDLLVAAGVSNLAGWTLLEATSVSANGLTVVGTGINPTGQTEAWVATIPEPSTFLLAALTIAVSAGICFRLAAAAPAAPTQL